MDVIIANPICTDMVWRTTMATQEKTRSYVEQTLGGDFIPLIIETYECFHFCFNLFLTTCAWTTIACHQWSSLVPSILISYYQQHVTIVLQRA
jgi:uncharacterized membrane protein